MRPGPRRSTPRSRARAPRGPRSRPRAPPGWTPRCAPSRRSPSACTSARRSPTCANSTGLVTPASEAMRSSETVGPARRIARSAASSRRARSAIRGRPRRAALGAFRSRHDNDYLLAVCYSPPEEATHGHVAVRRALPPARQLRPRLRRAHAHGPARHRRDPEGALGPLLPQRLEPEERDVAALVPRQRHAARRAARERPRGLVPQPLRAHAAARERGRRRDPRGRHAPT